MEEFNLRDDHFEDKDDEQISTKEEVFDIELIEYKTNSQQVLVKTIGSALSSYEHLTESLILKLSVNRICLDALSLGSR